MQITEMLIFRVMKFLFLLIVIILTGTSSLCRASSPSIKNQVILSQYLNQSGKQFNCYFTIEEAETHTGQIHNSYRQKNILGTRVVTLDKLIRKLEIDLPDAAIVRDAGNPKIIHIINRETKQSPNYPLDRHLTLLYHGDLPGLANAIGKNMNGTVEPQGFFTTVDMAMDYITQVRINVREMPVRDILTTGIPLAGYSRVLWRAVPSDVREDGSISMYIQFYGMSPQPLKSIQTAKPKPHITPTDLPHIPFK